MRGSSLMARSKAPSTMSSRAASMTATSKGRPGRAPRRAARGAPRSPSAASAHSTASALDHLARRSAGWSRSVDGEEHPAAVHVDARDRAPLRTAVRRSKRAVHQNVLPLPGLAAHADRAVHRLAAAAWPARARGRDPPYRRARAVVDLREGLEELGLTPSGEMPTPVSLTSKRASDASAALLGHRDAEHDLAVVGELDGVAHQVHEHLTEPRRIAAQAARGGPAAGPPSW